MRARSAGERPVPSSSGAAAPPRSGCPPPRSGCRTSASSGPSLLGSCRDLGGEKEPPQAVRPCLPWTDAQGPRPLWTQRPSQSLGSWQSLILQPVPSPACWQFSAHSLGSPLPPPPTSTPCQSHCLSASPQPALRGSKSGVPTHRVMHLTLRQLTLLLETPWVSPGAERTRDSPSRAVVWSVRPGGRTGRSCARSSCV